MKSLITFAIVMLVALPLQAQKTNIKTFSVTIEDFINYVAENYEQQEVEGENEEDHHITFLIQVANADLATEDLVILKQGFKLLSERLNDNNSISILTYFGYNGIALEDILPSELDKVNNVLADLKSNIEEFHDDGFELAYKYANDNYEEDVTNSIVIIRNPNASNPDIASLTKKEIKKMKNKKKKKDILKIAVSLLPEILAIIKN